MYLKNEIKWAKVFEKLSLPWPSKEFTMSRTHVQLCYNRFKEDRERRPSTTMLVWMIIEFTIRELANDVDTSFGLCLAIFTDVLGMKRKAAKIVPKLLNFKQIQRPMGIAHVMMTTFNDDPDLFKKAITRDESFVCGYDIGTKAQSYQCNRPEEAFFRIVKNRESTPKHNQQFYLPKAN